MKPQTIAEFFTSTKKILQWKTSLLYCVGLTNMYQNEKYQNKLSDSSLLVPISTPANFLSFSLCPLISCYLYNLACHRFDLPKSFKEIQPIHDWWIFMESIFYFFNDCSKKTLFFWNTFLFLEATSQKNWLF